MSKLLKRREVTSHRQSILEDDTRSHLRQFLTTIKKHSTPRPKRIISFSLNLSPSYGTNSNSPKAKENGNFSLPIIAPRPKIQKKTGINQFEEHIISNYLNAHLKVKSNGSTIQHKSKPKLKRKKNILKNKARKATNNTTIQESQLQTQRGIQELQKSAISRKDYSLKQQPMKHYVQQKLERKKREWKEKSPLELVTFFYQLGPQTQKQGFNPFISMEKKENPIKITLPPVQSIPTFIKKYQPSSKDIKIIELIHKQTFTVFQDEDYLYFGQSLQKKKHGLGVLIKQNYCFEGYWNNDGKSKGLQKTVKGTYTGSFVNNEREGKGEFRWIQGQLYSGEWRNGKKHGAGMWVSPNGDTYMGQWKNGIVEGEGVHKCNNGQRYQGSFKNFLKHGYGKQYFPNKDFYEGNYFEGLPHGKGHYIWNNGASYEGDFVRGFREGTGTLKNLKGFSFTGKFVQQFAEGDCQINYGNGEFYSGQIKRGKRNGKGTLRNTLQRKIFDGFWKDDQFDVPEQN